MSHIVRGQVNLAYTDVELLKRALSTIGTVHENERAVIATGVDYVKSGEKYPIVLEARGNSKFRLGFKREGDYYVPYYDNWGDLGTWCNKSMEALKDRYIAFHYEQRLKAEGFEVKVQSLPDGSIEVLAEEATW